MSRRHSLNRWFFDLPLACILGRAIHARKVAFEPRSQSTATKFFRNVEQLSALKGPLARIARAQPPLRVLIAGCSYGCEAYTLAGFLLSEFPGLGWQIAGIDICEDALATARAAIFTKAHGLGCPRTPLARQVERLLFDRIGEQWIVKAAIRERVLFERCDVLSPDFSKHRDYDLVFGQNFLLHMDDAAAGEAFARLVGATRPGGALFAGGMTLHTKCDLLRRHELVPSDWRIKAIHEEDEVRRSAWPWHYWALEPFRPAHPDFTARYSTIFVKSEA